MFPRRILLGLGLALLVAFTASKALAGSTYFYVNVPRFGGCATTNLTTRYTWSNAWAFYNLQVGGNKVLRFRPMRRGSPVGNFYEGTTGSYVWGPYTKLVRPGERVYGQICNQWWRPVNVEASGIFNSH